MVRRSCHSAPECTLQSSSKPKKDTRITLSDAFLMDSKPCHVPTNAKALLNCPYKYFLLISENFVILIPHTVTSTICAELQGLCVLCSTCCTTHCGLAAALVMNQWWFEGVSTLV